MPRISGWNAVTPRSTAPESAAARFELAGSLKTGMAEASDVAALPGGRFIVVGDKKDSAVIVDADGKRTPLDLPGLKNGKSQLEGVAYDPVRHNLFVSREESRELLRYEVEFARDLFVQGLPLIGMVNRELALDLDLFSRGGLEILRAIERRDYDVLSARPAISKATKLQLALRAVTGKFLPFVRLGQPSTRKAA